MTSSYSYCHCQRQCKGSRYGICLLVHCRRCIDYFLRVMGKCAACAHCISLYPSRHACDGLTFSFELATPIYRDIATEFCSHSSSQLSRSPFCPFALLSRRIAGPILDGSLVGDMEPMPTLRSRKQRTAPTVLHVIPAHCHPQTPKICILDRK